MPSNPMQRKVRNSFLLGVLTMLLVAALIGGIVFLLVLKPKLDKEKEKEIQTLCVYRLKPGNDVKSGETITSDMVEKVNIEVKDKTTDFFLAEKSKDGKNVEKQAFPGGYNSKLNLKAGTILTKSLLNEEEEIMPDSLRYVEYNMITMPTTLEEGDFIDIRLRLGNAQDFIVIPKKEILSIYGQTIGLNLTEEEILILNSAIVENYLIAASELYTTKYVEAGNQVAAIYTYVPTEEVMKLINMDENIIATARTALANLYAKKVNDAGATNLEQTRQSISNELGKYDETTKSYNLEAGIQQQIQSAVKARQDYLSGLEGY